MECTIYIVLTPVYEGKPGDKSLPAYGRMGQVIFLKTRKSIFEKLAKPTKAIMNNLHLRV